MYKDIALGVSCLAALALALLYIGQAPKLERERAAREVARLEQRARALERHIATLSSQSGDVASIDPVSPGWGAAQQEGTLPATALGADAGSVPGAPDRLRHTPQDEITGIVLRKLLETDLPQGIAAVDEIVKSARGTPGARTVLNCLSQLAENHDPAVETALRSYTHAESRLLRLHAAKLLEQRGDKLPLMSLLDDLAADLSSGQVRDKLRALALLHLSGVPSSATKIEPWLRDSDPAVRRAAVLALRGFDDRSLPTTLGPLLKDPDVRVQQAVRSVLGVTP